MTKRKWVELYVRIFALICAIVFEIATVWKAITPSLQKDTIGYIVIALSWAFVVATLSIGTLDLCRFNRNNK